MVAGGSTPHRAARPAPIRQGAFRHGDAVNVTTRDHVKGGRHFRVIGGRRRDDGVVEYRLMGWSWEKFWEPARNLRRAPVW